MKFACPHCSQRLDLDAAALESLRDAADFECPACGGSVSLADLPGDPGTTPPPSPGGWAAPDAEELSRSFDSRYQIIRLLGRGGMGAVYEGLDTRLDRKVAIKILPVETGRSMDALARFEREAKAMAALDHPNIVHTLLGPHGSQHLYLDGYRVGSVPPAKWSVGPPGGSQQLARSLPARPTDLCWPLKRVPRL